MQWRHGSMRGGTPALFDPDVGGYITFFHSSVGDRPGVGCQTTYYMGFCVFAAKPPFAIQQMTMTPLRGPRTYEDLPKPDKWRILFPAGLIITPEAYVVTYGKHDSCTQVIRFDRKKLIDELQPPVPASWQGSSSLGS